MSCVSCVSFTEVQAAIDATIPATADWKPSVFRFGQILKALSPVLGDHDIRVMAERWHAAAHPSVTVAEVWEELYQAVTVADWPAKWEAAAMRASTMPTPAEAMGFPPKLQALACLCRALQDIAGDSPFALSVRRAAAHVGSDLPKVGSELLRTLAEKGIIRQVGPVGSLADRVERGDKTTARATEWRYSGGQLKPTVEHAPTSTLLPPDDGCGQYQGERR
jgi:hypothetical protein